MDVFGHFWPLKQLWRPCSLPVFAPKCLKFQVWGWPILPNSNLPNLPTFTPSMTQIVDFQAKMANFGGHFGTFWAAILKKWYPTASLYDQSLPKMQKNKFDTFLDFLGDFSTIFINKLKYLPEIISKSLFGKNWWKSCIFQG